jgi:hypothetical protein
MRRAAMPALLALALFCVSVAAAGRGAGEIALFDAPKGAWLGGLRDDAPLVILEERDGWRHVRLDAWIMGPPTGPAGAGGATPPRRPAAEPASEAGADSEGVPGSTARSTVQGVLAPLIGAGGPAGAGVLVLLVAESDALDADHRKAGTECRARLEQEDRTIEALREEANRALNSSDNFREASGHNDRLKSRLASEMRDRQALIQSCRARAQKIFEPSVAQRAISDGSGRFDFKRVAPGRYRTVAFETTGDSPRSWSFSFAVTGSERRVLDPLADRSPVSADWDLR